MEEQNLGAKSNRKHGEEQPELEWRFQTSERGLRRDLLGASAQRTDREVRLVISPAIRTREAVEDLLPQLARLCTSLWNSSRY
jgi:hypothetical protein